MTFNPVPKPTKHRKKSTKHTPDWRKQEKRMNTKYAILLKLRAGLKCERCGKEYPLYESANGYKIPQGLNCSHYKSRTYRNTRWLYDNTDCICSGCHFYLEADKEVRYRGWKMEHNWTEQALDDLNLLAQSPFTGDRGLVEFWIDAELKSQLTGYPVLDYSCLKEIYKGMVND